MLDKNCIEQLSSNGKFSEVRQVVGVFDCQRNGNKFRVEITDSGNADDNFRYMVTVINPNGTKNTKARGNGGKTILHAIQVVHWSNLELDENCAKTA